MSIHASDTKAGGKSSRRRMLFRWLLPFILAAAGFLLMTAARHIP